MRRFRSILSTLLAVAALVGPAIAAADILWECRPACTGPLATTTHIRIGTLSGPWPTILAYLGRTPVAGAGWFLEHRTAAEAPAGWTDPVIGVDDGGLPAAVRSPAERHVGIDDPDLLADARAALAQRIDAERARRIAALSGSADDQLWQVSRAMQIQAAISASTATTADRAELAILLTRAAAVDALRHYGATPTTPAMWGTAAGTSLYDWAAANLASPEALAALDPAAPPPAAPQWP